jgi:hypothetical protein
MLVTTVEIGYAIDLLRHSKRFDRIANRIGFRLATRLRVFRATGIRLFTRKTVARLLVAEATSYTVRRGHKRGA